MSNVMPYFGSSRVGLGAVFFASSLLGTAGIVTAQESEPAGVRVPGAVWYTPAPPDRPRLGVFLDAACAPANSAAECERAPVVVSVVEDGPAFRAGVEARDTLIAVDGKSLATTEGRSALQDLSAGKPVLLSLAGPSGRREVSVTPEVRSDAGTMRFQWSVPAPDGAEEGVQVFRFPAPKVVEELEIRLDSIQGAGAGSSFVLIEPDSAGGLQVKVGDSKSLKFRARAPDSGSESEGAWIVRSPDLAQRLETVRDRTLEVARLQLDSLARLHEGVVLAPMPEFGRGRVAGAELRQMTPELAEYFEGREQGLLVLRVIPDTPASRLGLRGGDVVIEANGTPLGTSGELREQILRGADRGTTVKWIRKGTEMSGILRTR